MKLNYMVMFGLMVSGSLLGTTEAHADCVCRCVSGEMTPICSSSIDLPPICPAQICPITPPSIAPIPSPRVPPVGTRECRPEQVLNPYTGRYEWKSICR